MKRKAILLKQGLNDHDLFTSTKDCSLVKYFLQSAQGGCFMDEEIDEYTSTEIEKEYLIDQLENADYSFVYFSGHSFFLERLIHLPLSKGDFIKESDLIRPNKKQWIFLDCCRTNKETLPSPEFYIARHSNMLTPKTNAALESWVNDINHFGSFYMIYYTTKMGEYAHKNENGGYGTQSFFYDNDGTNKQRYRVVNERINANS
jgi:hypothetical protein